MRTNSQKTIRRNRTLEVVKKPTIEHPVEGERVNSAHYSLRIAAEGARMVRVAIDQGPWLDCRHAVGYWWYDWMPERSGEYEFVACADYEGGRETVSDTVHCVKE